ncbi:hypothetical protein ZWY2020_025670 [Hordeum vulgare]|nr:hypothetical protein ZWY2020_025670 [Hordeum vulgare]
MALPDAPRGSAAEPFIVEDQNGVFLLEFEEEDYEKDSDLKSVNGAILSADPGKLTLRTLKHELQHIMAGDWDWQISQMGDVDFSLVFPSVDLLNLAKSRASFSRLSMTSLSRCATPFMRRWCRSQCRRIGSASTASPRNTDALSG